MKWLFSLMVFVMMCTPAVAAQIEPASLSYQGTLADNSGQPLTGAQHLQVCLYDSPSGAAGLPADGGTAFWCDEYDVTLQGGLFSIVLGRDDNSLTGLLDQFDGITFVGLKVGTDAEMANRQKLTSVPYALKAKSAQSADNAVPVGTIVAWHKSLSGTPALADGWVECDGSVVSDADSPYNGQAVPNLNSPKNSWNSKGSFLRGSDTSGVFEDDSFQGHGHNISYSGTNYEFRRESTGSPNVDVETSGEPADDTTYLLSNLASQLSATAPETYGSNGSPRYSLETRPVNMSVVWIIKIK